MPTSSRQIPTLAEKESDHHVLRGSGESDSERTCAVGENVKITMDYDRNTDVMFLDLCGEPPHARIEVFDIGDHVGFPGQVLARVDAENGMVYGITIQRYSAFKHKLMWGYRMASIRRALQLFVNTLVAGACMTRHAPA
jgi:hypothetical protein